jgi:hypothetical protein
MTGARWLAGAVAALLFAPAPLASHAGAPAQTGTVAAAAAATTPANGWRSSRTLLAWTPGRLPNGFAERVRRSPALDREVVVRSNIVGLRAARDRSGTIVDRAPDGFVYPLETFSLRPVAYRRLLAREARPAFDRLSDRTGLLSRTSARVRRLGTGARLRLRGGHTVRIVGIVDDRLVGGAELVVNRKLGRRLGVTRQRYVLARLTGPRREAVAAIRRAAGSQRVETLMPDEVPILRDASAVLPQSAVKAAFGEFAYRPDSGRGVSLNAGWVRRNIVTATVPVLGSVRCHRKVIAPLRAALREVRERGLAGHINPRDYAGCYAPRMSSLSARLSRHAWGIAVDLNASSNGFGTRGNMDRRVVAIFERHGFGWGGHWLKPDPMHFESLAP